MMVLYMKLTASIWRIFGGNVILDDYLQDRIGDCGSDRGAVLPSVYGKDTGTLSMVVLGWDGS